MKRISKHNRAFTLVEAVLAMGIVGVGVVAVFGTISSSSEGAAVAAEEVVAIALAQDLIAEINSRPFSPTGTTPPVRVGSHLAVCYTFANGTGTAASDDSGVTPLQPLHFANGNVSWMPGTNGVSINQGGALHAGAGKIYTACVGSRRITVEIWFEPQSLEQQGRPVFGMGDSAGAVNFLLTQNGDSLTFELRLHAAGMITLSTPPGSLAANRVVHCAITFDGSAATLYLNGSRTATTSVTGTFNNWQQYPLSLGAMPGMEGWQGRVFLVAVHYRALSADEVMQNQHAGPFPSGLHARTGYSSIDNYSNFIEEPPRDESGALIPGAAGFRRQVEIVSVLPSNLTSQQTWNSTDAKRISVSIYKENRLVTRLVSARYRGVSPSDWE